MHAQMAAIHCRLGEMGVVHIAHTISSYKIFLKYGPPIFFRNWTGPYWGKVVHITLILCKMDHLVKNGPVHFLKPFLKGKILRSSERGVNSILTTIRHPPANDK